MVPKEASFAARKTNLQIRRDEEWVSSTIAEADLEYLVQAGLLPDRATTGWRPAVDEPYPMPNTNELVNFEVFSWRRFGVPVHPFVKDLLEHYWIGLCNLHPNSILHLSVFIHFYEAYLGILPHFNLFRYFFHIKKRGGSGSRVVGGVYLQLRDGMASEIYYSPTEHVVEGVASKVVLYQARGTMCALQCRLHPG